MQATGRSMRWQRALWVGVLAAALALLDLPYSARFFGLEVAASLAHLHTGFLLAVAMVVRDPLPLRIGVAANLAVWLGKTAVAGELDGARGLYGILAMLATYGLLRLAARAAGWPRDQVREGGFSVFDLPRYGLIACVLLPVAFAMLAAILEVLLMGRELGDPALQSAMTQTLLAKLFGVLILTLPLVVLATHRASAPVQGVEMWRMLPWSLLVFGVLLPVLVLQALSQPGAWHPLLTALVDYRLVLAALLILTSVSMRLRRSMTLLVLAQLLFALGLTVVASEGRDVPDVLGLLRIALELMILQMLVLVVFLYHRERDHHLIRLADDSRRDPLTGLPNFNALAMRINEPRSSRALGFLLLDRTETIRNSLGLAAESGLMRAVARRLAPDVDAFYLAPGQFALLPASEAAATDWNEVLRAAHLLEFRWSGQPYRLLPYLGVAQRTQGEALEDWLPRASNLAFDARERGEAEPLLAPARLHPISGARRRSALELSGAVLSQLRAGALELYAQPIVPLRTELLAAHGPRAEILCRLRGQDGRLMSPALFIPALAADRRMAELDLAVLKSLQTFLERHVRELDPGLRLSINVDAQSLASHSFVEALVRLIGELPIPASALCFEVTETAAITRVGESSQLFHRLRGLGCAISIDDFGVGFQSFERLKQLPVDQIKIDGTFVREMRSSPRDAALVSAAVAVARAFDASTVAEFVMNQETANLLSALGVDWGQGELYGLAGPIAEVLLSSAASSRASHPAR